MMVAFDHPAVSVIVPLYNAEQFVRTTLESVAAQDLDTFEVVCVDDGSTDGSRDIVRELAVRDQRIKLICQENRGAGQARNAGIDAAVGEFITFLDADDWYSGTDYLRVLYEGAKRNDQLVAAACFANYRGSNDIETDFSHSIHYEGYSFSQDGVVSYKDYQFDYGFHRFIFAHRLFDAGHNRFPDLTFFEDPVFLVRILNQAQSFYATNKVSYLYRCEYKQVRWTTRKALDLLEGVRQNLVFSKEHGLAKLHWYTAHHLDNESSSVGVGINKNLDMRAVDEKLKSVEASIDHELLARVDEADAAFVPSLRKPAALRWLRSAKSALGYWWRHR